MSKLMFKGWICACLTALLWAMYAIVMKLGISFFDNIHPVTFILQSYIFSSLVLLISSGSGRLSIETLRNSNTWFYGTLQILNNIFLMTAFTFAITATSATILLRVGIIISALIAILHGKNEIKSTAGFLCIILGVITVCSGIDVEHKVIAIFLVILSALSQVLQVKVSESHKENNKATGDIKSELRVTGYVVAVTASFYALLIAVSITLGLNKYLGGLVPTLDEFLSISSLGLAVFTGIFVISTMKYCMFYSTKTIGSANFLVIVAFTPVITILIEKGLEVSSILEIQSLSYYDLIGCLLIVIGALLNVKNELNKSSKTKKMPKKAKKELNVLRDTIRTSMITFNDDMDKVANALGVGKRTINQIMTTDKEFSKATRDKIIYGHAENVQGLDHLTGALNKSSFNMALNRINETDKAIVMFIDLDKFKPVNDTYGHKAGDHILEGVSERLMNEYKQPNVVARLGGDEYCLIIYGETTESINKHILKVKQLVTASFLVDVDGVDTDISVGCSIGAAHYPTEGTNGQELHDIADKRMYEDKDSKGNVR